MGDVVIENPTNIIAPHKSQHASSTIPGLDSPDILPNAGDEYSTYKRLQQELEYINLQEEYIKDEQR